MKIKNNFNQFIYLSHTNTCIDGLIIQKQFRFNLNPIHLSENWWPSAAFLTLSPSSGAFSLKRIQSQ